MQVQISAEDAQAVESWRAAHLEVTAEAERRRQQREQDAEALRQKKHDEQIERQHRQAQMARIIEQGGANYESKKRELQLRRAQGILDAHAKSAPSKEMEKVVDKVKDMYTLKKKFEESRETFQKAGEGWAKRMMLEQKKELLKSNAELRVAGWTLNPRTGHMDPPEDWLQSMPPVKKEISNIAVETARKAMEEEERRRKIQMNHKSQ